MYTVYSRFAFSATDSFRRVIGIKCAGRHNDIIIFDSYAADRINIALRLNDTDQRFPDGRRWWIYRRQRDDGEVGHLMV